MGIWFCVSPRKTPPGKERVPRRVFNYAILPIRAAYFGAIPMYFREQTAYGANLPCKTVWIYVFLGLK